jgi:hypothetical protein
LAFVFLLSEEFAEFWDFPEFPGVGFHEGEEAAEAAPAFHGGGLVTNAVEQAIKESVNGMRASFEGDRVGAAEPLHEESHGSDVVTAFEEDGDDLSKAAAGAEVLNVLSPEGDVAGGFAGFAPECEDARDSDGGFDGPHSFDMGEVMNGGSGVGVPFFGEGAKVGEDCVMEIGASAGCGFAHGEGAGIEELADDVEEDFDAIVGNGIFAVGKEGKESLEAKNGPGIRESSAANPAVPEFDDFGDQASGLVKFGGANEPIDHHESGVDFGFDAGGEAGDDGCFFAAGLFVAHAGEHPGEVSVLDLVSAIFGEEHIEVMSDMSEWLSGFSGEFAESSSAFSGGEFEESLVEEVSLSGDDGEEGCK